MDSVDAIVLDLNMPEMTGFEFIEIATQRYGADLSPVFVMLTSSLNPEDQARLNRWMRSKTISPSQ